MTHDVAIVGAGPAGAVAAIVLARAGLRVVLIDRARFPRHKLCGDTLNPAALAILRRLGLAAVAEARGLRVEGIIVTGEGGARVEGRYPEPLYGCAISRMELDAALVDVAVAAGVEFRDSVAVQGPLLAHNPAPAVVGVSVNAKSGEREWRARVTIAADGRHSTLASALGVASHPRSPRRWAIGVYLQDVHGGSAFSEMHIRRGHYIGLAPLPGGLTNVCLVKPSADADRALRNPAAMLNAELALDPELRDRVAGARPASAPHVLGPLAVDVVSQTRVPHGLLMAGDACGCVDPMTGDGLRFALRGGELAAEAALQALAHGWTGVHADLDRRRQNEFGAKWQFNRVLRTLVGSPAAVWVGSRSARVAPAMIRRLIAHASDCDIATTSFSAEAGRLTS